MTWFGFSIARSATASRRIAVLVLIGILAAASVRAETLPGDDVAEMIDRVRRFNPELAARVLEADAVAARVEAAGALPDPVVSVELEDIDRRRDGPVPSRLGAVFYRVEQEFPLWGRREARRQIARSEALGARGRERVLANELAARVKAAFAQHFSAVRALATTEELGAILQTIAAVARGRYEQGFGSQQEVLRIEVERTRLARERAAIERGRRAAQARLNALLDRPAQAPLAAPRALRPLPSPDRIALAELVERMRHGNPELAAARAAIESARGEQALADKAWYPDVTLGLAAVDRERRFTGYEAMVSVKVPLQRGPRAAEQRAAGARHGAATAQLQAVDARLRGELEEAYWALDAARRTETLLARDLIPQTEATFRAALTGYQVGRADFALLLEIETRLLEARLDLIEVQREQQALLAEIERIVGDDL